MAKHYTVARPYAKSVFERALLDGQLENWSSALRVLALTAEDPHVIRMWNDPKVGESVLNDVFFQVLETVAADVVKQLGDKLKNFIGLLVLGKRLETLPDIEKLYHEMLIKHQKVVEAEVVSAFPLEDQQREKFQAALEKRFNSKVSITFKEEKALIGGALLRSGNWVLDGSIRSKIARLKEALA